ncbi:hypothetical protein NPS01_24170 [Nocardioides psychrotolerans]|uniref:DUF2332 domain-containing protein n=1 Tax=Nocardioides psychrotolerans TaxID=1005945 RepID=A0A1I3LAP5_9ACTN|nr:DUF2332 domain-containing protein [Nocardioides psychrotolerans]GEP38754.1 hypothetical protein NPS01_24170 [Nocardioides psychrotolerans]SFI81872.1 hypothetical protein SAMN05216561_11387 [Nocardioides psychrotolerans]
MGDLATALRQQAVACASLGSPMYADLLPRVADDLQEGGATAAVLAPWLDAAGPDGVGLRLLGSVHRLVLQRRAGGLGVFYPSVGGTWSPEDGWAAFRSLLEEEPAAVAEWLDRPPQTNEVGRATVLMAGLLALGRERALPVRLFEIGSSGGLNLLADQFRYVDADGSSIGPEDSPVVLDPAWSGVVPRGAVPEVVERIGSDVMPIDVRSTEGRLALTAYVWPDQVHRHERLRGALALAERTSLVVRRQAASAFVEDIALVEGARTVLWHSVIWQYVAREEQAAITVRIDELGAQATEAAPFAHVFLEPTRRTPSSGHEFLAVVESWPGGERRILGTSRGHGVPTHCE